ncbi:MAG: glycosyltransferase family 39 protein [Elusimicrobiota bacterium]|jgi:hypothetical protein
MKTRSPGAWTAAATFLVLVIGRNAGVLGYILGGPDRVDAGSAAASVAAAALALALLGVALVLLTAAGRGLLRLLGFDAGGPFGLALGMGLAGTGLLLAGTFLSLGPEVFVIVAATLLLLAGWGLLGPPGEGLTIPVREPDGGAPAWKGCVAGLLAFCAWHCLILGLAPPTQWDVLAYHLALPKLYLQANRILDLPWMLHSHWPHLMELLYSAPLALGRDSWPGLFHAGVSAVWILCVHRWAAPRLGSRAAFLGAAMLACQPVVLALAPTAHSDGGQALFYFLSCASLWRWAEEDGGPSWLILAGLLGGLAASCKLTGLVLAGSLALWTSLAAPRRAPWPRLKAAGLYLLAASLFCLPWYLRTASATGDPFWPFLNGLTHGPARDMLKAYENSVFWSFPRDLGLLLNNGPQFLLLPFGALLSGALLAGSRLPKDLKFLLAAGLPYLLVISRQQEAWRFAMACYPGMALASGWAADRLAARGAWRTWTAVAMTALGLWPSLTLTQNNALFPFLGLRSRLTPEKTPAQAYLSRSLDHYAFFKKASRLLPPGSRTLLFREIRGYYLDADYIWGDPVNQSLIAYRRLDLPGLEGRLSGLGVTHVLVNEGLGIYGEREGYYGREVLSVMGTLLAVQGRPILREGGLTLWELGVR